MHVFILKGDLYLSLLNEPLSQNLLQWRWRLLCSFLRVCLCKCVCVMHCTSETLSFKSRIKWRRWVMGLPRVKSQYGASHVHHKGCKRGLALTHFTLVLYECSKKYRIKMTISFWKSEWEALHPNMLFKILGHNVFSLSGRIAKKRVHFFTRSRSALTTELIWWNGWWAPAPFPFPARCYSLLPQFCKNMSHVTRRCWFFTKSSVSILKCSWIWWSLS